MLGPATSGGLADQHDQRCTVRAYLGHASGRWWRQATDVGWQLTLSHTPRILRTVRQFLGHVNDRRNGICVY